jgi:hypothetical protein
MAGQRQTGFAPPSVASATCSRRRTRRDRTVMCIPYTSKLSDAPLVRHHYEGDYYAKICKAQFDQL